METGETTMKLSKTTLTINGVSKRIVMHANPAYCMATNEDTIVIALAKQHDRMPTAFRTAAGFVAGVSSDWGASSDVIRVTRGHPLWTDARARAPYGEMLAA
jgi:hypothetical protein